jgi:5-oxoprolinase (ATP-hydrolysing)
VLTSDFASTPPPTTGTNGSPVYSRKHASLSKNSSCVDETFELNLQMARDEATEFWIDRGGTFTDIIAARSDGLLRTLKLLSENREHYADAALEGIRRLLGLNADNPIPAELIRSVKMGTTVATNALLERKGEPTALVINKNLRDVLRIGTQQRPRLFDLEIKLPSPIYDHVIEIPGRLSVEGIELEPLDEQRTEDVLQEAFASGFRAVAVALMHSFRFPQHESRVAAIARRVGFTQISASHEVSQLIKLVPRGETTVVDAYLSPVLHHYVDRLRQALPSVPIFFMQSNGGLASATQFRGKDAILSGPAGGMVGAIKAAEQAGFQKIVGFDMGGTSTDVTHFAGEYERRFESEIAGVRLRVPMLHIHTVAAGGGSICRFIGERFQVGPESAGADPGPACYRKGGPLTVTDCNLSLGRIQPQFFPAIFGPSGDQPIDRLATESQLSPIAEATGRSREEVAEGFVRIAVENMANAIKEISVARGYDLRNYTLVSFGGAGGQHACAVADALSISRILIHPLAGLLSAYGIGIADLRLLRDASIEINLDLSGFRFARKRLDELEADARQGIERQGATPHQVIRRIHVRYAGTDTAIVLDDAPLEELTSAFAAAHQKVFGFTMQDRGLAIEAVSVEAISRGMPFSVGHSEVVVSNGPVGEVSVFLSGEWRNTPVWERNKIAVGAQLEGPALIVESHATTALEIGWRAEITRERNLVLMRAIPRPRRIEIGIEADPVQLELFHNLFFSVAEQMGAVIRNTAYSVNIKERLDYSCALFDAEGQLVANAPHMPVHLGSMGTAVRSIIERRKNDVCRGDSFALNDPFRGGTHLPDITVVSPVFVAGDQPHFWVASRGHHADVGGLTPGSMPPTSRTIDDEGILIDDLLLVRSGQLQEKALVEKLTEGPLPARNLAQNLGDIHAQLAANQKGIAVMLEIVERYGSEAVHAYMNYIRQNAAEQVRQIIDHLTPGTFLLQMDCGAQIQVTITINRETRSARIDFAGTSAQVADNFNAPSAVVRAAVLYVFRTLIREPIPLNDGCLEPIAIEIPAGSMLDPRPPAAVVAGNVETSQAVVNALYGALGVLAAAQGTMNNLTFGNARYQYYETVCGGAGAGHGFHGASAVHTHMTNSRMTDPEVLELRYPVIVSEFRIRAGSGGKGRWNGGDGVVRRIAFREAMTVAILAGSRQIPPFGLRGGGAGATGKTSILRADGTREVLDSCATADVHPGDSIIVETPGGGGFGRHSRR